MMGAIALASTADSLRRQIPKLSGEEKSAAYQQLYQTLSDGNQLEPLLQCLDQWIEHEARQGNTKEEAKVRWYKLVDIANYGEDSLMLDEATLQMNWFMHHDEWQRYYDAWDCKVNSYIYTNRLQTALREAQNILDDANVRRNNFGRAVAYMQMGVIYEMMGQYDPAVLVFKECLGQLKDSYRDSEVITNAYDYLCQTLDECYRYQEELNVTYEWEKTIQERLSSGKVASRSMQSNYIACRCNRALALTKLGRYADADSELSQAEEMLKENDTPLARYRILLVRAIHALDKGMPHVAQDYCDSLQRLGLNAGGNIQLLQGDIFLKAGRPAEAAQLFRQLYQSKDSVFNRDMRHARRLAAEHDKLQESNRKLEQSNKELQVANTRAEEASQMKTNFIQQISHEIRTPLNILSGFTQILTTPGMEMDDATKRDISERITENTARITGLVNKMLSLSDAGSRTMIECNDHVLAVQIAAQAAELLQIGQNPKIDFDLQISPEAESAMLQTNVEQATQALGMLLDNAQKFTYGKYSNAGPGENGRVLLNVTVGSQYVQFIVQDNGIGVPKQEASHIFEEFVQLDSFYEGTGIGLTIARSIARRMGGDVVLDTTYTDGARFILRLPYSSGQGSN